jgi:uncharacterized protein YbbK (DUF523 family)
MSRARPLVAVSACLLGQRVRYDGKEKRNETILGSLAEQFDYLPFCPEVGIGLPVPRPPLQLVQQDNGIRILGVDDRSVDVTEPLRDYGRKMALSFADVAGVIFKCRSPSCGLGSVPLHDTAGAEIGMTTGAFAREIVTAMPNLPLVEEENLIDPKCYNDFLRRVMNRHASR